MTTNNQYYKTILETLTGSPVSGTHSDNYYLKRICQEYGYTYTDNKCNGKYLKDMAEAICDTTYAGSHFNNYYLHQMAKVLTNNPSLGNNYDNYFLGLISANILPKTPTIITIDPNLSDLVYGDDFNLTGVLTDNASTPNPVSGATVNLKVGNTIIGTDTTGNDGGFSFTYVPMSMGTHSFQVVFDGDTAYDPSNSSISIIAQKETTILNVSSPANDSDWYSDGSVSITGVLTDNDSPSANPISDASIVVHDNNGTTYDTLTTLSDGSFSGAVSVSDLGADEVYISYLGDSSFEASVSGKIELDIVSPFISLTGDNQVLSFADSTQQNPQKCTLTATLYSADLNGKSIQFYDYSDSSNPTLLGTGTTNSSGVATYDYVSQGRGDVNVKAVYGSLVSETYSIRDVYYYASLSKIKSNWNENTSVSGRIIYTAPIPLEPYGDLTLEFKYSNIGSGAINTVLGVDLFAPPRWDISCAIIGKTNNIASYYSRSSWYRNQDGSSTSFNSNSTYKIILSNGIAKWYKDDVEFASYSVEATTTPYLRFDEFNSNRSILEYLIVEL